MYITIQEFRDYQGITELTDVALIESLMASAQGFIESAAGAGRKFMVAEDSTRIVEHLIGGRTLRLDMDLCAITEIINGDGTIVSEHIDDNANIVPAQFKTYPRNETPYYILEGATWWQGDVTITGRWGFSVTPPEEIKQAFRRLVATWYRGKDNMSDSAQQSFITSSGTVVVPSAVPRDVMATLYPYKRRM